MLQLTIPLQCFSQYSYDCPKMTLKQVYFGLSSDDSLSLNLPLTFESFNLPSTFVNEKKSSTCHYFSLYFD